MSDHPSFVALDLGASSGRAVVGTFTDEGLRAREVHRFANVPVDLAGTLYWDLPLLHREIIEGIRLARDLAGPSLTGVGVDTWGVDFGLLDERGRPLMNPVHYRDRRNDGMMEQVFRTVDRRRLFETTGIQFLPFNTIFQLAAMRLRDWPALDAAATLLMMPDLMSYLLCESMRSEFTIATTTQCYDPRAGAWALDLLRELDLPAEIFPEIAPTGSVLGELRPEIARETNAAGLTVIAPAAHDTGSAVAAAPVAPTVAPGRWAYISSGTWSLMGLEVEKPIITDLALLHNFTNEGGAAGRYRFLKNIAGLWLVQECRRAWSLAEGAERSYEDLNREALTAPAFAALLDPDHPSFLHPERMPEAIIDFCRRTGQSPPASRGAMVRAILESLALTYRRTRDALEEISGEPIEVVHVVGGGSQNELLNQFTADALGVPVLAGPTEATALGNLVLQAMAMKVVPDLAAARDLIRRSTDLKTFEPRDPGRWDQAAAHFAQVVEKGRPD